MVISVGLQLGGRTATLNLRPEGAVIKPATAKSGLTLWPQIPKGILMILRGKSRISKNND